jgi:hypothetical protein
VVLSTLLRVLRSAPAAPIAHDTPPAHRVNDALAHATIEFLLARARQPVPRYGDDNDDPDPFAVGEFRGGLRQPIDASTRQGTHTAIGDRHQVAHDLYRATSDRLCKR